MCEEFFVGGAEVIEAPFTIRRPRETVLWTFAIAGEADAAIAAILWQLVALGVAKVFSHLAVG